MYKPVITITYGIPHTDGTSIEYPRCCGCCMCCGWVCPLYKPVIGSPWWAVWHGVVWHGVVCTMYKPVIENDLLEYPHRRYVNRLNYEPRLLVCPVRVIHRLEVRILTWLWAVGTGDGYTSVVGNDMVG